MPSGSPLTPFVYPMIPLDGTTAGSTASGMFSSFNISFTDWDIVSSEKQFIGLENYQKMVNDPVFLKTLVNTFRYVIFGLPVTLVLSFIIAYNLNKIKRGLGLYRTLYFIPYMTSLVAVSWVWRWLYQPLPLGFFNNILSFFGLAQQPFLQSTSQA